MLQVMVIDHFGDNRLFVFSLKNRKQVGGVDLLVFFSGNKKMVQRVLPKIQRQTTIRNLNTPIGNLIFRQGISALSVFDS
jgi:hypothetical protein